MKKAVIIFFSVFLLLTVGLYITDHVLKNDPIVCPDEAQVVSITVAENEGEAKTIDEYYYATLIAGIRNSNPTTKDSVNDRPYAENYYTLTVNTEDMQYCYFVYQKGSEYYIEKPYEGIYKVHEVINLILSKQFVSE